MTDAAPRHVTVLVYSSDADVRRRVMVSLGRRPSRELVVNYVEAGQHGEVIERCDAGGIDLAILDGEAAPSGGMGICRQLKEELDAPPPVLILTGRRDDAWLATWSRAEAAVPHPIDAVRLISAVTGLLLPDALPAAGP